MNLEFEDNLGFKVKSSGSVSEAADFFSFFFFFVGMMSDCAKVVDCDLQGSH